MFVISGPATKAAAGRLQQGRRETAADDDLDPETPRHLPAGSDASPGSGRCPSFIMAYKVVAVTIVFLLIFRS